MPVEQGLKVKAIPEPPQEAIGPEQGHDLFADLVRRHYRGVYAFAYSRLRRADAAEDATQEAFLRAYRFSWRCPDLRDFAPWIMGIARNCVKEQLRRARPAPSGPPTPSPAAGPGFPESVRHAIEKLGDRPRMVLSLKYVEGLSVRQIAGETGMSVAAVKVTLFRAYEFIRTRVAHEMP